ncbi:protein ALTERED PHOSPHATE STARVATION RESPONSE 1-like [Prosopis cineraria]|uniref:protein ALTERED PHOSPHATE STARVATION RESPONSE 1-like n=1 Tax=Prosopis cineraria TaxID=364024 RepID=UPI00240EE063|nr:protein ALTERED PHOSPHATE STARVATION RESPONSE 1-like [Prosopis cineraria]
MGCNSSRLDRLPAVALCRDRCKFLDEALRQSYILADAHLAHMHSLRTLGPALYSFFRHHEDSGDCADRKIKSNPTNSPPLVASPDHASSSSSDSDLLVHSHSESSGTENNTDKDFQFLNPTRYDYLDRDTAPDDVVFMNYMQPLYPPFSPPQPNSKPPSPPPPSSSAWDFLNLFETFEKYDVRYSPSREIKEEKRKTQQGSKNEATEAVDGSDNGGRKAGKAENGEAKKVKAGSREKEERGAEDSSNSAKVKSPKGVSEVMKEIQILMERASYSGSQVLEMLDVGKLRYHRKIAVNPVSCKMMHVFTPLVSSKSPAVTSTESSLMCQSKDEGNLPSTLKKLSLWEKKLYDEVKVEEKLHVLYEKKWKQLNSMNKKGSDAQKVDSLENLIQIISTKMKISIQVVDKVSNTICKLREEELWPLINEFILRFLGMWKEMLECYRRQKEGIEEAKRLEAWSFNGKLISREQVDAAIRLKCELQKWNTSFSEWVYAQKCHAKALNGWLQRWLPDEGGEETGCPSVLVLCDKWSQAADSMGEKNVIEGVNEFISGVNELLEKYIRELQPRVTADKELERRVKLAERQEQKMHRAVRAREGNTQESEGAVRHALLFQSGTATLPSALSHMFAALHHFAAVSASAYQQLLSHHIQLHTTHALH